MIKFFRRIRQKLLSEGNTGRYLKYAIGEIILVVIGILIALQIGNINENRKKQKQAVNLKKALKTELIADLELLKLDYKYVEDELQINNSIAERLSKESSNLDTLVRIVRHEYKIGFNNTRDLNKTTFTSLESTGTINLLGNDLAKNVQEFYLQRELTKEIFSINISIYFNLMEAFMLKYPGENFAFNGNLLEAYWENADLVSLNGMFNALLTARLSNLNVRKSVLQESIDKTQELINQLNESDI